MRTQTLGATGARRQAAGPGGPAGRPERLVAALALAVSGACADAPGPDPAEGAGAVASNPPAEAWFGVPLPPPFEPHTLQVLGGRPAAPAAVPAGEGGRTHLEGASIRADLETIVGFARESRERAEVGEGLLWGRITGLASGTRTVEWAADRLRAAGIEDVTVQGFEQDADASLWLPLSWEVRLLGDESFGPGSADVALESAMPLSAGGLGPEGVTAPLVFVGAASSAELARVDVRGKVAVQKTVPQGHTVFVRDPVGPRAVELLERGAVAVLTVVDLPGNMRVRDMGCGGGACFNLGGRDGRFVEAVLGAAATAGRSDEVRVRVRLESERASGLSAANAVAVLPGSTRPGEHIVINAHADAWFDGAGDNGDGLAVLLGLARHFAGSGRRPERTLVFVASAGHHTPGLSGPSRFLEMNPSIARSTVLVVNLEHTSQRHVTPARSEHEDGHREWTMDAHEAPIVAGVSNGSPFLEDLVARGIERYGTNFVSAPNPMASGEGGAFRRAGLPVFTAMQGPPMYHTTGEVLEMVSEPGLERMARFTAWFVERVSEVEAERIGG